MRTLFATHECVWCGKPDHLTVHHIHPIGKGGNNDTDNRILLCPPHHRLIHMKVPPMRALAKAVSRVLKPRHKVDMEAVRALQEIDTNCNDCKHLQRIFGPEGIAATDGSDPSKTGKPTVFYGNCMKKGTRVMFMPMTNMIENGILGENCFEHRRA